MAKKDKRKQPETIRRVPQTPRLESGDESKEMLSEWWHDNGKYLIAGAVFALLGIIGWKGWGYYTETRAKEAATHYEELLDYIALENVQEATRILSTMRDQYASTTYALFASFAMAKFKVEQGQLEEAKLNLQWVTEHSQYEELQSLAWVRLARVLLELGETKEAYDIVLSRSFPRGMEALASEVQGDYLAREGSYERAKAAYRGAVSSSLADDYNFIMMKEEEINGKLGSVK